MLRINTTDKTVEIQKNTESVMVRELGKIQPVYNSKTLYLKEGNTTLCYETFANHIFINNEEIFPENIKERIEDLFNLGGTSPVTTLERVFNKLPRFMEIDGEPYIACFLIRINTAQESTFLRLLYEPVQGSPECVKIMISDENAILGYDQTHLWNTENDLEDNFGKYRWMCFYIRLGSENRIRLNLSRYLSDKDAITAIDVYVVGGLYTEYAGNTSTSKTPQNQNYFLRSLMCLTPENSKDGIFPMHVIITNYPGFQGCYALRTLMIPLFQGLTRVLPQYFLYNLVSLTELHLNNNLLPTDFVYCHALEKITHIENFNYQLASGTTYLGGNLTTLDSQNTNNFPPENFDKFLDMLPVQNANKTIKIGTILYSRISTDTKRKASALKITLAA